MKRLYKFILATGLIAIPAAASAQNMYDAINLSRNVYFGTARSMALSNAVTALGGDLGTVGINPAGSAVASYGQLTITPGLMISSVASQYSAGNQFNGTTSYMRKAVMPNWGVSANFSTGRSRGLKSFVVAVTSNYTNQYLITSISTAPIARPPRWLNLRLPQKGVTRVFWTITIRSRAAISLGIS